MADDNDKHNPDHVEIDLDAARRGGPRLDEGAQTIMGGGAQTLMLTSDMLTSTQPGDEERRQAAPLPKERRQATPRSKPQPLAETDPRLTATGAGQTVRRYADGRMFTARGHMVDPRETVSQRVVDLPYGAEDVVTRIGPYDVLGELGRGAMGVVYKAFSVRLRRLCALKVMRAGEQATEADLIRFQNEAMLAARLNHPNIVQVYDSGEFDDEFYFVMEFIPGPSFEGLIEEGSPDAVKKGLRALAQAGRALTFAHEKGVVHRDIKPDNILLDDDYNPHITDFGIAKAINVPAEEAGGLTQAGAAMGTPYYMPPEQANGEVENIGPLSDVYALGATMYHLVTGRTPFIGETVFALLLEVIKKEPDPPTRVCMEIRGRALDQDLETICLKAMEKEAHRRYPSAQALAEDIEAYLEDRPISARPLSRAERLQKLMRRNRSALVGAFVVLSVLLLMTVAFGSVVAFNMARSSESLRELDRKAAIDQAGTLERAIRTNMLQGRADVAREVVNKLIEEPGLNRVRVVRTDRTYAYTDRATLDWVVARLTKPAIVEWIKRDHPDMLPKIEEAKRSAVPNIDRMALDEAGEFEYDQEKWDAMLAAEETVSEVRDIDGEPTLVVLKPIINSKKCQVCHGRPAESLYNEHNVRAVLVIYRSLADVEKRIRENQLATLLVGLITTLLFVVLAFVFARLFGIGLRPQQFGQRD